jgi:hypothetical protein
VAYATSLKFQKSALYYIRTFWFLNIKLNKQHTTKSICSSSELVKIPNPLSMTTTLVSRKVEASAWLADARRSWAAGPKSLQNKKKKKSLNQFHFGDEITYYLGPEPSSIIAYLCSITGGFGFRWFSWRYWYRRCRLARWAREPVIFPTSRLWRAINKGWFGVMGCKAENTSFNQVSEDTKYLTHTGVAS